MNSVISVNDSVNAIDELLYPANSEDSNHPNNSQSNESNSSELEVLMASIENEPLPSATSSNDFVPVLLMQVSTASTASTAVKPRNEVWVRRSMQPTGPSHDPRANQPGIYYGDIEDKTETSRWSRCMKLAEKWEMCVYKVYNPQNYLFLVQENEKNGQAQQKLTIIWITCVEKNNHQNEKYEKYTQTEKDRGERGRNKREKKFQFLI